MKGAEGLQKCDPKIILFTPKYELPCSSGQKCKTGDVDLFRWFLHFPNCFSGP